MPFTKSQMEAITSSGENILVSAGAGSGKTTVLTSRVIDLLNHGRHLKRMLILTFTNNAAASMRRKIRKAVLEKSKEKPELLSEEKDLDSSDICTFDSFNQKLVKKYFYKLGIEADFSLVSASLLEGELRKDIQKEFAKLYQSQNETFFKLLNAYTVKDDSEISSFVFNIIKGEESVLDPMQDLKEKRKDPLYSLSLIKEAYQAALEEGKKLTSLFLKGMAQCQDDDVAYGEVKKGITAVFDGYESLTDFGQMKAMYSRYKDQRFSKKKNCESTFSPIYEAAKKAFREPMESLFRSFPSEEKTSSLIASQKDYICLLLDVALASYADFQSFKKEHKIYEFHDIALLASRLLKEHEDVRKEVSQSYDEIMVDEYQDNSLLQEDFLSLIGRNNVFMVGDVKQSIYGFRGSRPDFFMKRYTDYQSDPSKGKLIVMNENFRSTKEVISSINIIFSQLMFASFGGADYEKEHQIIAGNSSLYPYKYPTKLIEYSEKGNSQAPDAALEAEIAANEILKMIADGVSVYDEEKKTSVKASFKDFALILDRGTSFDKIEEVFKKMHIPLKIEKNLDVSQQTIILIIRSLFVLYYCLSQSDLSSPRFRHALLSLARGPLGKYSEKELNELFLKGNFKDDYLTKKMGEAVKKTSGQDILSIYRCLIKEFAVLDCLKDFKDPSSSLQFLLVYESQVENMAQLSYTVEDAIEYFHMIDDNDSMKIELQVNASFDDAVTLINIHKSKGLEYPFIFFLGLSKKYNFSSSKERMHYDPHYGLVLPFLKEDFIEEHQLGQIKKDVPDNPLKTAYDLQEKRKDKEEKLRLLYVALTRAKYQMIFLLNSLSRGKIVTKEASDSFSSLLEASGYTPLIQKVDKEEYEKNLIKFEKALPVNEVKKKISYEELPKLSYQTSSRASKTQVHQNQDALKEGTLLHSYLEMVDLKHPDLSFIKEEKEKKIVNDFLNSELRKKYQDYEDYHEYGFIDPLTGIEGSIDLLLLSEKEAIIIDYKTKNLSDEDYPRQLEIYKSNIERIFKRKTVCYLYSLLSSTYEKIC
jgi:ATP-dependent helicase/nuclease subunit A